MSSIIPTASEIAYTSTRIGLFGRFDNKKIIPGEKYRPILFIRNKKRDATTFDLDVSMSYFIRGECNPSCGPIYTKSRSYSVGTLGGNGFSVRKNMGYIVVPDTKISFFVSQNGNSQFVSDEPKVRIGAKTDKWEVTRHEDFEISTSHQSVFADFTYSLNNGVAYLDANPSISADGTIISYTWNHKGAEVARGRSATVPVPDIDSGNGFAEVTLNVESITGLTGRSEKMFALNAKSWKPQFNTELSGKWKGDAQNNCTGESRAISIDIDQEVEKSLFVGTTRGLISNVPDTFLRIFGVQGEFIDRDEFGNLPIGSDPSGIRADPFGRDVKLNFSEALGGLPPLYLTLTKNGNELSGTYGDGCSDGFVTTSLRLNRT